MINQKAFYESLEKEGVTFITGVPDTLLNEFCKYVDTHLPKEQHVIAANEGNAIGLAAGYQVGTGTVPLVYMQNSGIGNAMNPLLSLTNKDVFGIPMVLLIGWRGDPSINDHPQHAKQGELTTVLMEDMDIPFRVVENDDEKAIETAQWAVQTAKKMSSPVALIGQKGVFSKAKKDEVDDSNSPYSMSREEAMECLIEYLPKNSIFVATTGRATRELYGLRNKYGSGHNQDFLNVGAMGHASSIANGIALAQKKRLVVCLDGDSAAIMHLGSLTTAGKLQSKNFLHVVLNNGAHESVGGQPSAGFMANFTVIAENSGYQTVGKPVETASELQETVKKLLAKEGPAFIDVHVRKGIRKDLGPLDINHREYKEALMKLLIEDS
jgi:phosphonopyruvate decarboxylase